MTRNLADEAATMLLGAELAQAALRLASDSPLVAHLRGELGAGKTGCVRGFLRSLGVAGPIKSPTYALVEVYELERTVVHCDLYRLGTPDELQQLGLRDYLLPRHIILIEWPERGGARVPPPDVRVELEYHNEVRRATLMATSRAGEQWLSGMGS